MSGNELLRAAAAVAEFLAAQDIPYVVMGGLAVQYWGEPRMTRDVDVTVMVPPHKVEGFLREALDRFEPRISDALDFALRRRILLIRTADGIPVDVSLGIPGYEEEVMRRAVEVNFLGLVPLRLMSAEDLIVHKCVAGRPRDLEDIERVMIRQKLKLDLPYIRRWLKAFESLVETREVKSVFETAVRKVRRVLKRKVR